jgi:hypothetical protein
MVFNLGSVQTGATQNVSLEIVCIYCKYILIDSKYPLGERKG